MQIIFDLLRYFLNYEKGDPGSYDQRFELIVVEKISSIKHYIKQIKQDTTSWSNIWFRGEPSGTPTPLLPRIYRNQHDEDKLLQLFRMKAPMFAPGIVPDRDKTDQWLFLAQHFKLPTRLLDWTESALVALYFALEENDPAVYVLNPWELNKRSLKPGKTISSEFPLTWFSPRNDSVQSDGHIKYDWKAQIGHENIRGAWEEEGTRGIIAPGTDLPVAIHPTYLHPRMSAQRSCFTIHGHKKEPLTKLFEGVYLIKYEIDTKSESIEVLRKDLRLLGIDHSTIYPDLEGLSKELREKF